MFVMLSPTGGRVVFVTHTDDFRVAGDCEADVEYVVVNFHAKFKITPVTTGVMLGVEVLSGGLRREDIGSTSFRRYPDLKTNTKALVQLDLKTLVQVRPS